MKLANLTGYAYVKITYVYNSDKGHDWLIGRSRKPFKNSEKKDEDD